MNLSYSEFQETPINQLRNGQHQGYNPHMDINNQYNQIPNQNSTCQNGMCGQNQQMMPPQINNGMDLDYMRQEQQEQQMQQLPSITNEELEELARQLKTDDAILSEVIKDEKLNNEEKDNTILSYIPKIARDPLIFLVLYLLLSLPQARVFVGKVIPHTLPDATGVVSFTGVFIYGLLLVSLFALAKYFIN